MNKKTLITILFLLSTRLFGLLHAQEKSLYFISDSHLDTQWNWDVKTTINEYIPNTLTQNFSLFEKYPDFHFNFEGGIHYMWVKEYYPDLYAKLKKYIQSGRWHVSGGSIDANDVMTPSAESIIRNFLYGQAFYKKEFGRKGGSDVMLPDCFGFPYSLPTLAKHCGMTGFHTQKLSWGSAYDYNSLAPFGIWKGVDGSEIYAIFKGEAYDQHEEYNKDMSNDSKILNVVNSNQSNYGVPFAFRYVGPRGDRGGALKDNAGEQGENTPYWLQTSVNSTGPVKVYLSTPDEIFALLEQYRNDNYFVWDNELPMSTHGVGCYTSQAIMKYWNRKNELLADATEKCSVFADWTGGLDYPAGIIRDSWTRLLWHQFHDDLTGTSIPNAYNYSYNDEILVNSDLSRTLTHASGAIARQMDTQVEGIPLVVYNPLSIQRTDVVEASVIVDSAPENIRILDGSGNEVLSQTTGYDSASGKLSFLFEASVPSLGYVVYELRLDEESKTGSDLSITRRKIENELYALSLNANGDVASVYDKEQGMELLANPIRLALFDDYSWWYPAWEINWAVVDSDPVAYVDEGVDVSIAENGPLRVSLRVKRSKNGSEFVQYIRLVPARISKRIDFVNELNWQTRGTMLKAVFPLKAGNPDATYDLSLGAIERGVNTSGLYEVAGHQWADQTHTNGTYGVSILNDCKYGWDKPDASTLRLTLIHTPSVYSRYTYQRDQDLGLNRFTYSLFRHLEGWNETTPWEAARLNQPLLAFRTPKHEGGFGRSAGFVSLNTDKVAVKALKKAEDSDEIIVRVYELTGNAQSNVNISFPAAILSAQEVNGVEETIGTAQFSGQELTFDIGRFQPKTFAVRLSDPETGIATSHPASVMLDLAYNIDVMSYDSKKNDATSGVVYAYPAELFPENSMVVSDGIQFKIGSRTNGSPNAVYCNKQEITLPAASDNKKLYILAGSKNEAGSVAAFVLDGAEYSFEIPYYAGKAGAWETEYTLGSYFSKEDIAFTATHRHNVSGNKNDLYDFLYMYAYCIPLKGNETKLVFPDNKEVYVFAVTLSDNENDDIAPATAIHSFPEFADLEVNNDDCGKRLEPRRISASSQNGSKEGPDKATDWDLSTKWCVTSNSTPWLQFIFEKPVEVCRWMVMNAGNESIDYITRKFRLQRYDSGQWQDMDAVEDNTVNKVNRPVNPFTAQRIRLQIDQGEQNGNTTRILEFAVFGENDSLPSSLQNNERVKSNFRISGNYPNPVVKETVIKCTAIESLTRLELSVYDLFGNVVDTKEYRIVANRSDCELTWDRGAVVGGVYLYRVSAFSGETLISAAASKMIVK